MWMEVRGFWLIGIRVCLLLLLIKKILIAIVLIVITSNTLVQQIVKTIISQQTIELTPEYIDYLREKMSSKIKRILQSF